MKFTKKIDKNYKQFFEALSYSNEKVVLETSDINDPDIQKMIKLYANSNNIPFFVAVNVLQQKIDEMVSNLSTSPEINKNAIANAAAGQAFGLMEEIKLDNVDWKVLGVERDDLLDNDIFFDLTESIIKENPTFFPLRNPFENKSIKPFFYMAPDDIYRMNDPVLQAHSKGKFTAFCTPSAQIVFNREFSERMCMYSLMSNKKPKSKKYVSNGGEIPDHYEYIEFIIVHELLHYTAGDHFYTKSMVKKIQKKHPGVSTGLAHKILNYVGDYINNWTLLKSGYSQLPIGLFSEVLNYDKMETYEDIIEAVVEEFAQMSGQDLDKMTDSLDGMMDDHMDNAGEGPSQGGGGEPSDNPDSALGAGGEGGEGKGSGGADGKSGKPSDNSNKGKFKVGDIVTINSTGQKAKITSISAADENGKQDVQVEEILDESKLNEMSLTSDDITMYDGDDIADAIDEAMKDAQEKMKNKDDGNTENDTSDILNGKIGAEIKNARDAAKRAAGDGSAQVDTSYTNKPINWKKVLKKMIPVPSIEMEDCYSKMSRDSISSAASAVSTGSARIKPGDCPDDPDKKGLCIIIDNSGSVSEVLNGFNQQIIKLLLNKKTAAMLENFYVIKFSDDFVTFKVDVKKGIFQEVIQIKNIFKKGGKVIDNNPKLKGPILSVKTKLFNKTYAGGTSYTPELHFVVNAMHKANFNLILFTDDDLAQGQENEKYLKKFYALGNKKKGSCAVMLKDKYSYDGMGGTFGKPKWVTYLT